MVYALVADGNWKTGKMKQNKQKKGFWICRRIYKAILHMLSLFEAARVAVYILLRRSLCGPIVDTWSFGLEFMMYYQQYTDSASVERYKDISDPRQIDFGKTRRAIEKLVQKGNAPKNVKRERFEYEDTPCEWIYYEHSINILNGVHIPHEEESKIVLWLHGGGYCILSIDTHIELISKVLKSSGSTTTRVLAIDYKLAPEYPFPHALNEVVKIYKWLVNDRGYNPSNISFAGDSSGGGLTLASVIQLRDMNVPLPCCIVLLSPWVDLECKDQSYERNRETDYLSRDKCQVVGMAYAGKDIKNPLVSPINADLHGLPPMLIQAGEREVFIDSQIDFFNKAISHGVEASIEVYKDMPHVHQALYPLVSRSASIAISSIGHFIQDYHNHKLDKTPPRLLTKDLNPNHHSDLFMYSYYKENSKLN